MKKTRLFVVLATLIGISFLGQAQVKFNSILTSGKAETFSHLAPQTTPAVKSSNIMITHSTSQNIVQGTVACVDQTTGYTAENHYVRAFNLLTEFSISGNFNITGIEFGVENATSATGAGQPVSVKLYTLSGAMNFANMTLIGQKDTIIPDMTAAHMMVPVTATVGAGQILIVDIHIPDGQTAQHTFFLGSNGLGQTAPSYLASNDCSVPNPVTYASIGFGSVHLVINVYGDVAAGIEELSTPSIKAWPNPASELIHVDLPQGSWMVEMIDISGKIMLQAELNGQATLATDHMPKGLYLLRANNGTTTLQQKVVIR